LLQVLALQAAQAQLLHLLVVLLLAPQAQT
jgi:hypothetical protein